MGMCQISFQEQGMNISTKGKLKGTERDKNKFVFWSHPHAHPRV